MKKTQVIAIFFVYGLIARPWLDLLQEIVSPFCYSNCYFYAYGLAWFSQNESTGKVLDNGWWIPNFGPILTYLHGLEHCIVAGDTETANDPEWLTNSRVSVSKMLNAFVNQHRFGH